MKGSEWSFPRFAFSTFLLPLYQHIYDVLPLQSCDFCQVTYVVCGCLPTYDFANLVEKERERDNPGDDPAAARIMWAVLWRRFLIV